ncbi:MAG: LysM peptidoglycan-binding domain-containing protein [Ignavibacteria bacterium]|nr:LysM peptidoglycan-binding domain-containing protein [Ignavibacteria bacterium]
MTRSTSQANNPLAGLSTAPTTDTLSRAEMEVALKDSLVPDSNYDVVTAQLLERAHQHYLSALEAEQQNDSVHSATEFEYAIAILNELGYYPNIESNSDFDDLSHSVIEDYEKYIAVIDSLSPNTSIFALRKKLNQIDEANETGDQDQTKKVITTTSIPLVINGHVEQNINFFRGRGHAHFEHWLYVSGKYFPIMRKVFGEEGIPEELVSLSMIESGLNPVARSWARAVGLWQFVKGTGQMYGLQGNFWYDERRDFEKATHAAARHLKDLHAEFDDWYLALAAYNSGAGRVYSAIRRSKSRDFWKMRPFLPRETRNYVPQFIAVAVLTMSPKEYGFDVTPADSLKYETVTVNDCVDLSVLAKCADTDVGTLRELNPELVQWCTPPGTKDYTLRVPEGSSTTFAEKYTGIPDDQKRDWFQHKVKRRESLSSIAKYYGVTTSVIAEVNHLKGNRLQVGKTIVIPIPSIGKHTIAVAADQPTRRKGSRSPQRAKIAAEEMKDKVKMTYRIRKGDTLGKIADWYDARISDLRMWNEIPYGRSIRAGNTLTIWVSIGQIDKYAAIDHISDEQHAKLLVANASDEDMQSKPGHTTSYWTKYRVKRGDNLGKIASRYGTTSDDIRKWNALQSDNVMKGQTLDILIEDNTPARGATLAVRDSAKSGKTISYKVKKGDTLHSIASTFGVSIRQLQSWNNIRGTRIHIGQELVINS